MSIASDYVGNKYKKVWQKWLANNDAVIMKYITKLTVSSDPNKNVMF